jgi:glutathione S-transferase
MSTIKPITLYSHASGPNPWKVAIILKELDLPYEEIFMDMADLKKPPYEKLNPNGRVPTIVDPNTDITLWETGAIIEYLIDTYDKEHKLSLDTFPEKYHQKQWLYFQASGQGPYYGQAAWFTNFHPEKIPSAIERYRKEMVRVVGVIDRGLEGKEYLVGNKCTYADLSFLTWHSLIDRVSKDEPLDIASYKNYNAWIERLMARPAVKKVFEEKAAKMHH